MRQIGTMIKSELGNYIKNPSALTIVALPILMSKLIIIATEGLEGDVFVLSMWIIFAQVMVGIMLTAPNLLEERESKTFQALLCTPMSFNQIVLAKGIAIFILSMISQVMVVVINQGVPSEQVVLLLPMILGAVIFSAIGMIIGLKAKSTQSGTAISSVVMVVMFLVISVYSVFPSWTLEISRWIPSISLSQMMNVIFDQQEVLLVQTGIALFWVVLCIGVIYTIGTRWKK